MDEIRRRRTEVLQLASAYLIRVASSQELDSQVSRDEVMIVRTQLDAAILECAMAIRDNNKRAYQKSARKPVSLPRVEGDPIPFLGPPPRKLQQQPPRYPPAHKPDPDFVPDQDIMEIPEDI